jgi:hypothetical protein
MGGNQLVAQVTVTVISNLEYLFYSPSSNSPRNCNLLQDIGHTSDLHCLWKVTISAEDSV